jgi:hypothetical protein
VPGWRFLNNCLIEPTSHYVKTAVHHQEDLQAGDKGAEEFLMI